MARQFPCSMSKIDLRAIFLGSRREPGMQITRLKRLPVTQVIAQAGMIWQEPHLHVSVAIGAITLSREQGARASRQASGGTCFSTGPGIV